MLGGKFNLLTMSLPKEEDFGRDDGPNEGDVDAEVGLGPSFELRRCAQYFSSI
jgi:hypothetical protein